MTLTGGNEYPAKVIGMDEDKDVAVLHIDTAGKDVLHPLQLGSSSDIQVRARGAAASSALFGRFGSGGWSGCGSGCSMGLLRGAPPRGVRLRAASP